MWIETPDGVLVNLEQVAQIQESDGEMKLLLSAGNTVVVRLDDPQIRRAIMATLGANNIKKLAPPTRL